MKQAILTILFGSFLFLCGLFVGTYHPVPFTQIAESLSSDKAEIELVEIPAVTDPVIENNIPDEPEVPVDPLIYQEIEVKSGDTLSILLENAGVGRIDSYLIIEAFNDIYDVRKLRPGQKLTLGFLEIEDKSAATEIEGPAPEGQEQPAVVISKKLDVRSLTMERSTITYKVTKNEEDDEYNGEKLEKELTKKIEYASGRVDISLSGLAESLRIPPNILYTAIKAYSFDVDFQRDIQPSTKFEVLYEAYYDENGKKVAEGDLLYSMLKVPAGELELYRYIHEDKSKGLYTKDGRTLRKGLMRTPINGARISSKFGMRRHPISGYNRLHRGIDFAAPTGTPVYAAGDGVISFKGKAGGYGNYIKVKHNKEYTTAYAHLSKFAKGMKKGRRVRQGQVIAYVGSTGASTGPHLHYEVIRNGKHTNPANIKMPKGVKLDKKELETFKTQQEELLKLLQETPKRTLKTMTKPEAESDEKSEENPTN